MSPGSGNVRFLLDVNVGRTVKEFLEAEGYDIIWIADVDPQASDEEILAFGLEQERIIITVDKDFGDLIFNQRLPSRGVINLSQEKPSVQIRALKVLLEGHSDTIANHFIVVEANRLRIRPL